MLRFFFWLYSLFLHAKETSTRNFDTDGEAGAGGSNQAAATGHAASSGGDRRRDGASTGAACCSRILDELSSLGITHVVCSSGMSRRTLLAELGIEEESLMTEPSGETGN